MVAPVSEIYLVRHGESLSNVEGRFCGQPPGPGLTPRGRAQALAAAALLPQRAVSVVSSPLLRAVETAQAYTAAVDVRTELRETGLGVWDGSLQAELVDVPRFRSWRQDPENCPPPGGERLSEMAVRIGGLLRTMAALGDVVAYSHMHPIIGFLLDALGRSYADHASLRIPNATVVRMEWDGERFRLVEIDRSPSLVEG